MCRIVAYLIEDILELVLRQRRALDVFDCPELLGHPLAVLLANRLHLLLGQLFPHTRVIAQIRLCADDQARHARAVVVDLREPFLAHVFERSGRRDTGAYEENVCLRV